MTKLSELVAPYKVLLPNIQVIKNSHFYIHKVMVNCFLSFFALFEMTGFGLFEWMWKRATCRCTTQANSRHGMHMYLDVLLSNELDS